MDTVQHMRTADYPTRVAAEVRAEMARKNITALELSQLTGIPQTTLARRLRGFVPFDVAELAAVATVLEVDTPDLMRRASAGAA